MKTLNNFSTFELTNAEDVKGGTGCYTPPPPPPCSCTCGGGKSRKTPKVKSPKTIKVKSSKCK